MCASTGADNWTDISYSGLKATIGRYTESLLRFREQYRFLQSLEQSEPI